MAITKEHVDQAEPQVTVMNDAQTALALEKHGLLDVSALAALLGTDVATATWLQQGGAYDLNRTTLRPLASYPKAFGALVLRYLKVLGAAQTTMPGQDLVPNERAEEAPTAFGDLNLSHVAALTDGTRGETGSYNRATYPQAVRRVQALTSCGLSIESLAQYCGAEPKDVAVWLSGASSAMPWGSATFSRYLVALRYVSDAGPNLEPDNTPRRITAPTF